MAIVGAFIRIGGASADHVRNELAAIEGISLFDIDNPRKVGLVVEAVDLDAAHTVLTSRVRGVAGVLGVWPVYAHFGPEDDENPVLPKGFTGVEGVTT